MRATKATPVRGATRLYAMPAAPDKRRGRAESVKSRLKLRPPEPLYIAGEDLDFSWYEWQIEALKEDYSAGVPLMDIADKQGRDYREVAFMLMELAHYGRLEPRDSGVFGQMPRAAY